MKTRRSHIRQKETDALAQGGRNFAYFFCFSKPSMDWIFPTSLRENEITHSTDSNANLILKQPTYIYRNTALPLLWALLSPLKDTGKSNHYKQKGKPNIAEENMCMTTEFPQVRNVVLLICTRKLLSHGKKQLEGGKEKRRSMMNSYPSFCLWLVPGGLSMLFTFLFLHCLLFL